MKMLPTSAPNVGIAEAVAGTARASSSRVNGKQRFMVLTVVGDGLTTGWQPRAGPEQTPTIGGECSPWVRLRWPSRSRAISTVASHHLTPQEDKRCAGAGIRNL